jgi:hypothetical protein
MNYLFKIYQSNTINFIKDFIKYFLKLLLINSLFLLKNDNFLYENIK